jgi:hypothetical protein
VIFLGIFGLALVAVVLAAAFTLPRDRRYQCEVCGKYLTERQAVEVTEEYPEEFGGTSMTATFCKKDRP